MGWGGVWKRCWVLDNKDWVVGGMEKKGMEWSGVGGVSVVVGSGGGGRDSGCEGVECGGGLDLVLKGANC